MGNTKYSKVETTNRTVVEEETTIESQEKIERITSVKPSKVKKGLANRLVSGVLGPDGVSSVGEFVLEDIIKPAIKNLIVDTVTSGVNKMVYGDKGGPTYRSGYGRSYGHGRGVDYSSRYRREETREEKSPQRSRGRYIDDYILNDRREASDVLAGLTEYADRYGNVTVADYYEAIGVESAYTDHSWGWDSDLIRQATAVSTRGGYVIKFPAPDVIK